jgi:hypothetical protein
MKINRRDVLNVAFGEGTPENHLVIVLSPEEVNSEENQFLGMMISDSIYYDKNNDVSFSLDNTMFSRDLKSNLSRARLYLISFIEVEAVIGKICEMRIDAFQKLIKDLNNKIFDINCN